ncbi:hypothetical protein ACQPZF_24145 [Actinosynnema sp. CS-041913]|uniref:hypothetical protein n=1 Tax=Actinosynnema sp. CS-041913 TaxID=3239917 RepID=UPI003D8C57A6
MRKLGIRIGVVVAGLAAAVLMPGSAQAIGDNGSCTTLKGSNGGSAKVCGDYWRSGSLYDGTYSIRSSNVYVQFQADGGRWTAIGGKGTTGSGTFEQLRTFYLRACTNNGSACSGKW